MPTPARFLLYWTCCFSVLILLAGCRSTELPKTEVLRLQVDIDPAKMEAVSYTRDVQPLFNARCIACHSCFDAPGQLKLDCGEGVLRGATKQRVYATRLKNAANTRLHEDAQTEQEWRHKGFFRVLPDPGAATPKDRLESSVLYQMLALSRVRQLPHGGLLGGIVRDSHDLAVAPTIEEFPDYAATYPHAGMPFYTYGLNEEEFQTLIHWIAKGAPVEFKEETFTPDERKQVNTWEGLLNGKSKKDQLVARYLYEHWFAANLYFSELDNTTFFKLVRSRTAPGTPVDRISTRRPNDPPGEDRFYYRFVRKRGEVMRKTNLPVALDATKRQRLVSLFWQDDWDVAVLPLYSKALSGRPFEVFSAIPERARYQFLLDDSFYFVQSFIRGPVCRGQTALNVIRDHFSVLFVEPDEDPACNFPGFLDQQQDQLELPNRIKRFAGVLFGYPSVRRGLKKYHAQRSLTFAPGDETRKPAGLHTIWDGSKSTGQPLLTVFRHFDTATVTRGFLGPTPESTWLMDYSLLERVYYLLVVNYDVFGTVGHQLATRLYFDLLRYEGETNYLALLPSGERQSLFDDWYRDIARRTLRKNYHPLDTATPSSIAFTKELDTRKQLHTMLEQRQAGVHTAKHRVRQSLVQTWSELPQSVAPFVQYFPEVVFLRVSMKDGSYEVYTVLRNKALKNVSSLFGEAVRREPNKDRLLIVPGLVGDYPNLMMEVREDKLERLEAELHAAKSPERMLDFYLGHAVLRNSPEFWPLLDWFTAWDQKHHPIQSGRFDLKHYFLTRLLSLGDADLVDKK